MIAIRDLRDDMPDTVVGPIADLLYGDELIIVPDGLLYVVPNAAPVDHESRYLCETIGIRLVPSLACLKLITDCPAGRHSKTGALLVRDPCMKEVPTQWEGLSTIRIFLR